MLKRIINACRTSLWLDWINLIVKSLLHPESKKLKARLARVRRVREQGHSPLICDEPQIFLDISSLVTTNNATGIHRVVRSIAFHAARLGQYQGHRLSLVYATKYRQGYYHAFRYQTETLGVCAEGNIDQPIAYKHGDIFYGLDWNTKLIPYQREYYQRMYEEGVSVFLHVYDILPLQLTDIHDEKSQKNFEAWLVEASQYTGIFCNSQAVASDYSAWRRKKGLRDDFIVDYFYLGADIENSLPSHGLSARQAAFLQHQQTRTSILMVSSLDPRKGYEQALSAFELLWTRGGDVDLVVVGKHFDNNQLARRFREHPEAGKRFFWLEDVSDEFLQKLYQNASAVLFASRGEGFGLAVWEGARYGKPLILRDLPVFRELAGEQATYFSGEDAKALAECLECWLEDFWQGNTASSESIRPLMWNECVHSLLKSLVILQNQL